MFIGFLSGILTGILGWQINLIAIHQGIDGRRRSTFYVGAGAVLGDLIWIGAAFAGAKTLLTTHREYWVHVKWLGVFMVAFAGLQILFHKAKTVGKVPDPGNWFHMKNFLTGLFVVIGNPALLLVWIGFISFVITNFMPASEPSNVFHLLYMSGFLAGGLLWFLILAAVILPRIRKWSDDRFHFISKFFAAALLIAAAILVFKKF